MQHVPVLIFETNYQNHELWKTALKQQGVIPVSCLVPLIGGVVPPTEAYFHYILELHRPKLLVTSWRYIGPVVRKADPSGRRLYLLCLDQDREYAFASMCLDQESNPEFDVRSVA